MARPDRTKIVELANTTITVTTGASFELLTGNWHEAYLSLFVSIGTGEVDIEVSADDTNFVPATDVNGTALTDITADAYFVIPGKIKYIRANVPAATAGTVLVQVQKAQ